MNRYFIKKENGQVTAAAENAFFGQLDAGWEEVDEAAYLAAQEALEPQFDPAELARWDKIADLKRQLEATDYKAIKYAEGYYTEEQYAATKAQRQKLRDEINRLEKTAAPA